MNDATVLPQYLRLTEFLAELDSHAILRIEDIREHLEPFGITIDGPEMTFGVMSVTTPARTAATMRTEHEIDPLKGPEIDAAVPDDEMLIGAFELARSLVTLLLGVAPASDLALGRGKRFRLDVNQLRDAGF